MVNPTAVKWMREALDEAHMAAVIGEVPIGCVIVKDGQIIGRGHNMREHGQDATMHAEILAIQEACEYLHSWRLEDCELYVTLEPCPMCCGAILNARLPKVFYGAYDPKAGAVHSLYHLLNDDRLNHQVKVESLILAKDSGELLRSFFQEIRERRRNAKRTANQKKSQTQD